MEKFEIFFTFMKRYNVDMGMLHEEADGPWLPGGELNNDWVSNILAFVPRRMGNIGLILGFSTLEISILFF